MPPVSSQPASFGAVEDCGIAFILPERMNRIAAAYREDRSVYRDYLPLVIGKLTAPAQLELQRLPSYAENFSIYQDANFPHSAARDPQNCVERMGLSLESFSGERAAADLKQLAALTARLICGIARFDEHWFGAPQQSSVRYEHGMVSHSEGLHTIRMVGGWHRDNHDDAAAGAWREYLFRSAGPASCIPNRQTKHIAGQEVEETALKQQGCLIIRPHDATVTLIAAGPEGTFHRARRPLPNAAAKDSLLLRLIQIP